MKQHIIILCATALMLAGCGKSNPQPNPQQNTQPNTAAQSRVAAGEPKLIGSYTLFRLSNAQAVLDPESNDSSSKGVLPAEQWAEMKRRSCTMEIRADHTLVISNYPAPHDAAKLISIQGKWSLSSYRVFDAERYRISISGGQEAKLIRASCPADNLPDDRWPYLNVDCADASGQNLNLMFKKVDAKKEAEPAKGH